MKRLNLKAIYRVEYRNDYTAELEHASVFFETKEDAREYAEAFQHINCSAYIHVYWLNIK